MMRYLLRTANGSGYQCSCLSASSRQLLVCDGGHRSPPGRRFVSSVACATDAVTPSDSTIKARRSRQSVHYAATSDVSAHAERCSVVNTVLTQNADCHTAHLLVELGAHQTQPGLPQQQTNTAWPNIPSTSNSLRRQMQHQQSDNYVLQAHADAVQHQPNSRLACKHKRVLQTAPLVYSPCGRKDVLKHATSISKQIRKGRRVLLPAGSDMQLVRGGAALSSARTLLLSKSSKIGLAFQPSFSSKGSSSAPVQPGQSGGDTDSTTGREHSCSSGGNNSSSSSSSNKGIILFVTGLPEGQLRRFDRQPLVASCYGRTAQLAAAVFARLCQQGYTTVRAAGPDAVRVALLAVTDARRKLLGCGLDLAVVPATEFIGVDNVAGSEQQQLLEDNDEDEGPDEDRQFVRVCLLHVMRCQPQQPWQLLPWKVPAEQQPANNWRCQQPECQQQQQLAVQSCQQTAQQQQSAGSQHAMQLQEQQQQQQHQPLQESHQRYSLQYPQQQRWQQWQQQQREQHYQDAAVICSTWQPAASHDQLGSNGQVTRQQIAGMRLPMQEQDSGALEQPSSPVQQAGAAAAAPSHSNSILPARSIPTTCAAVLAASKRELELAAFNHAAGGHNGASKGSSCSGSTNSRNGPISSRSSSSNNISTSATIGSYLWPHATAYAQEDGHAALVLDEQLLDVQFSGHSAGVSAKQSIALLLQQQQHQKGRRQLVAAAQALAHQTQGMCRGST